MRDDDRVVLAKKTEETRAEETRTGRIFFLTTRRENNKRNVDNIYIYKRRNIYNICMSVSQGIEDTFFLVFFFLSFCTKKI